MQKARLAAGAAVGLLIVYVDSRPARDVTHVPVAGACSRRAVRASVGKASWRA